MPTSPSITQNPSPSAKEHGRAQRTNEQLQDRITELEEGLANARDSDGDQLLEQACRVLAMFFKSAGFSPRDIEGYPGGRSCSLTGNADGDGR